ncbi:MAG TPA: TonB-dependent receptor [Terriglobales bacterium]|nr:TonB-dependent receptor [Terriglobales bacterium]
MNVHICTAKFWLRSCLIMILAFLFSDGLLLRAQVESGKVVGAVRESTGAALAGAKITVTNIGTNVARVVTTNTSGEYAVSELLPGTYTVLAEDQGFKKAVQAPFKLDVNQVVRVDFLLTVGSINETVTVTAAEPLVESQTSSIGQVIEQSRVNDLPLDGRNFVQLAYLTPGVNSGPNLGYTVQQGNIPEDQRGNAAIQVNGLTATNNNFLLNGFDNNEQQIGIEVIQPSIDAIQEFKVQTSDFGADIGRGGAVVNVVLKSGSNQFHGGLFEFVRNSAFDAKNYFDDPNLPIAPFKQNQFGGTFGGPLIKDKTFFFVDYQGTRIRQAQTFISIVPSFSERGGNFSDLLTGQTFTPCPDGSGPAFDTGTMFDPFTNTPFTCANGTQVILRKPVPGNILPSCSSASDGACLDPAALKLVQLFPAPNRLLASGNYLSNPVARNNQDSFDVRGDHQLTRKDSLSLTFSYNNVHAFSPDPFPGNAGGGWATFSGHITNLARSAGISEVHTFSSDKINELKIGYSRYVVSAIENFAGQDLSDEYGIPGIFNPNNATATGGLPSIQFSSLSFLGSPDWFPEFLNENNYQYMDAFTYVRGRHSFKMGADVRRRLHGFFQTQNPRGDLVFNELFTSDLTTDTGGSALASFLMGYPDSTYRDGQKGSFGMRWTEFSAYLMDDFRVNDKLTLNLGVRYDLFTPPVEQENRLANFDFATGKFVAPQMPGVSASGDVKTDYNNFAPRVGFAWTPWNEKTVLRGGFGIFYDVQADQNDAELAYNPTGLIFSQSYIPAATATPSERISTGFPAAVYSTLSGPSGRASAAIFNNRTTYIEEWNLNIERALSKSMALQVAYVGTRGVKLAFLSNRNQPTQPLDSNFESCPTPTDSSCLTGAPTQFGRLYYGTVPNIGEIRTLADEAWSVSHGLQVKFEKRFSGNWSMLTSYTWQHTIGQTEENEYLEPQDTYNLAAERGDNAPDFRHQFSTAWSYLLPMGPNQKFWNGRGPAHWLTEGWQLNGIVAMHSGEAFTPLLSSDYTNTDSGAPRPDVVGNPYNFSNALSVGCPANKQTIECWYNPAAYAIPPLAPGQTFAHDYGDARRGSLRGPAIYNVDASLFKNFTFKENWKLQFRLEAFNLFNTPEFGIPNDAVDQIGSSATSAAGFVPSIAGAITGTAHASRELQLALKLSF